ncbi:MAG TPA: lytic transglycosylase domain-containing protein [Methylomirabilota bacterium]|nr:lytic transglycosylase domain-containing protein [Methylomirabilota bacterium]
MFRSLGPWPQMSTLLAGVVVIGVVMAAAAPGHGEVRFEDQGGVLYVTNVEQPITPASATVARPIRTTSVGRGSDTFRHLILAAADRYAVTPELVESVIRVESNFEPRAVSPKGAQGLMQLMPGTAKLLGVRDVFDVGQNIDGGVRHLRGLLDRYNGNIALALAAYNAGAEAVARHGGIPPFAETQAYVARILQLVGRVDARADMRVGALASTAGDLHRYQTADGAIVYSNVPVTRLSGAERARLERAP